VTCVECKASITVTAHSTDNNGHPSHQLCMKSSMHLPHCSLRSKKAAVATMAKLPSRGKKVTFAKDAFTALGI